MRWRRVRGDGRGGVRWRSVGDGKNRRDTDVDKRPMLYSLDSTVGRTSIQRTSLIKVATCSRSAKCSASWKAKSVLTLLSIVHRSPLLKYERACLHRDSVIASEILV